MPKFGYSIYGLDPALTAKASGRDLRISPKAAREICNTIKGMMLYEAKELLDEVIRLKRPIPFRRHKGKQAHKRGLQGWHSGRYPVKAARAIMKILDNVETNAEQKGLDVDNLRIIHAATHRGPVMKRYMPRAFGRTTPKFRSLTHVEIVVKEESSE
ncbi:MAG: 50S ribosomal protein L22 [Candidatus Freyarchaeota archaeon]|nr:50S ribosomal protein L22 [Candidatus Jordarchaeia archaeon]